MVNTDNGKLLILSPDFRVRNYVKVYLQNRGFEVLTCEHRDELSDIIEEYQPGTLLIDRNTDVYDARDLLDAEKPPGMSRLTLHLSLFQPIHFRLLFISPDDSIRLMLQLIYFVRGFDVFGLKTTKNSLYQIQAIEPDLICIDADVNNYDAIGFAKWFSKQDVKNRLKNPPSLLLRTKNPSLKDNLGVTNTVSLELTGDDLWEKIMNSLPAIFDGQNRDYQVNIMSPGGVYSYINKLIRENIHDWVYVDFEVHWHSEFIEAYGKDVYAPLVDTIAPKFAEIIRKYPEDRNIFSYGRKFYPFRFVFSIVTHMETYDQLINELVDLFSIEVQGVYNKEDRERGYIMLDGEEIPLMTLAYGICDVSTIGGKLENTVPIFERLDADFRQRYPTYYKRVDDKKPPPIMTQW